MCILCTLCIYVFDIFVTINSDFFPRQQKRIGLYSRKNCFLFKTVAVLLCYVGRVAQSVQRLTMAGRSGIESQWGRDFPHVQTGPGAHPTFCKMVTGSLPGVKCGRGVLLTTHPFLVPRSWKSRAISLPTLWATSGL